MSSTQALVTQLIHQISTLDIQIDHQHQVIHIQPPHQKSLSGQSRDVLKLSSYPFFKLNSHIQVLLQDAGYQVPMRCIEIPKMNGPDLTICIKDIFDLNMQKFDNIKICSNQVYVVLSTIQSDLIDHIIQMGIFINLTVSISYLDHVVDQICQTDHKYGSCDILVGQSSILEYSSPNMGKQMGIGHLRSTIIGQILANMMMYLGARVLRRNYLGDRGTPFGKLIYSLIYHHTLEGDQLIDDMIQNPTQTMLRLYAGFSHIESGDKLEKAKLYVTWLEQGYDPVVRLWHILRELTLVDFQSIYDQFAIVFDINHGESFTQQYLQEIEQDLARSGYIATSQGALIVRFEKIYKNGQESFVPIKADDNLDEINKSYEVILIRKSDGSTLYATRDLALMKYKASLGYQHLYNVVGAEQTLYFKLVSVLAYALGYLCQTCDFQHISFGMYLQDGSKMATRKGNIWRLADLIQTIAHTIGQQFESKIVHSQTSDKLAISALIFQDIKNDRTKDINFDIQAMTKLNGDTGIYLNYTLVRLQALIKKLGPQVYSPGGMTISYNQIEHQILMKLSTMPLILIQAHHHLKPHLIAQYTLDIVAMINHRYSTSEKIMDLDTEHKQIKVQIAHTMMIGLRNLISILHIPVVDQM